MKAEGLSAARNARDLLKCTFPPLLKGVTLPALALGRQPRPGARRDDERTAPEEALPLSQFIHTLLDKPPRWLGAGGLD